MSYHSLYRRMRPKTFDQIVGQEHITTALKNQVQRDTLGHAYLFSGTRGTGKTSTALVLAKAANCLSPRDGNPCLTCANCMGDSTLDIIEMDAASNNSVEDIRELREHVKFAPASGRRKVYIIDEVHMLSQGAFNALLKTLEEPPSYVMFILATTETHKVPMTIQSRCQKFEFRRVSPSGIRALLTQIVRDLGVEVSDGALSVIIAASDGAMRDSLGALEQCLSMTGNRVDEDAVHRVLGTAPQEDLLDLVRAALCHEQRALLDGVDRIAAQGKDFVQIASGLIDTMRDLLVILLVRDPHSTLLQTSDEMRASLAALADRVALPAVQRLFDDLVQLSQHLRYSRNKRALLEVTLLRASLAAPTSAQPNALTPPVAAPTPTSTSVAQPAPASDRTAAQPAALTVSTAQPAASMGSSTATRSAVPTPPRETAQPAPTSIRTQSAAQTPTSDTAARSDEALWQATLDVLKESNPSGWNLLRHSRVLKRTDNLITIGVENLNPLAESALNLSVKGDIEASISRVAGEPLRLAFQSIAIDAETMRSEIEQVTSYFERRGETVEVIEPNDK